MTAWTKFSERLPEESVEQVWVLYSHRTRPELTCRCAPWADWLKEHPAIAWWPVDRPEPPKPESQQDKDDDALSAYLLDDTAPHHIRGAWLWAIKYERAEVAKFMQRVSIGLYEGSRDGKSALEELRKRCGLDK